MIMTDTLYLKIVAKRLQAQGLTVEQVAEKMTFPLAYVEQLLTAEEALSLSTK